jgi:hypothetical protein
MNLAEMIDDLRTTPQNYLECVSPVYLHAFFHGYQTVDSSLGDLMQSLAARVEPASMTEMGPCLRIYLSESDPFHGVNILLDRLSEIAHATGDLAPRPGVFTGRGFASVISGAVKQGRPALVFAEPTVSWMFHFSRGFMVASERIVPNVAEAERARIEGFGKWLQGRYRWKVPAPWQKLIRIYEGEGPDGLAAFVRLWEEFASTVEAPP